MTTVDDSMAIDLLDPALYKAGLPYDQLAWLRENDPVHWHEEPEGPGFWVLTRHADVKALETDSATFSSEPWTVVTDGEPVGDEDHKLLIFSDPPGHTERRKFLGVELNPIQVRGQREHVAQLADDIIDEVIEQGECDLVEDVAGRLASFVIADMMGISRAEALELFPAAELLTRGVRTDQGVGAEAQMTVFGHAASAWADRRANPGSDWLSRLANGSYGGRAEDEMYFNLDFFHLITAGSDTSRNVVSTGMLRLIQHPEAYAELAADASKVPTAIEEMLRWDPPLGYQRRTATRDTEIHGHAIKAGAKVTGWYAAANRDPRVFTDPDTFDIHRDPNPHLTFGAGRHFCLGSHLARLELIEMFTALTRRIPDMELVGEVEMFDYDEIPSAQGPERIRVRFTPGPRVRR
jgi:cytochrome P450